MAHWISAQGQLKWVKIQKPAFFVTSPRENPPPKSNNFFLIETRILAESVDGLNSSVAIVAGEL